MLLRFFVLLKERNRKNLENKEGSKSLEDLGWEVTSSLCTSVEDTTTLTKWLPRRSRDLLRRNLTPCPQSRSLPPERELPIPLKGTLGSPFFRKKTSVSRFVSVLPYFILLCEPLPVCPPYRRGVRTRPDAILYPSLGPPRTSTFQRLWPTQTRNRRSGYQEWGIDVWL